MFKNHFKIWGLALTTALICSTSIFSQSVDITHGNGSNQTTIGIGPNESIVLFAEGSNLPAVDSFEFVFNAVPGVFGGVANPPSVVSVSGLGIFSGSSTTFTPASLSLSGDDEAVFSIPNSTVLTNGAPVAEIFLDTTGLSDGDIFEYGLDNGTLPGTTFSNAGATIETVSALTFFATVEAVPEPSSAGLLFAVGSVFLMRRKRA